MVSLGGVPSVVMCTLLIGDLGEFCLRFDFFMDLLSVLRETIPNPGAHQLPSLPVL